MNVQTWWIADGSSAWKCELGCPDSYSSGGFLALFYLKKNVGKEVGPQVNRRNLSHTSVKETPKQLPEKTANVLQTFLKKEPKEDISNNIKHGSQRSH